MDIAVTLICNPDAPALSEARVRDAAQRALGGGASAARIEALHDGVAYDLFAAFEPDSLATIEAAFRAEFADEAVDVAAQHAAGREKRLLVADMDSTVIGQECIDELADFAGLKAEISAITERAMRGELDFESALIERVGMLKGLPESVIEETIRTRITLNPGARTLVATMRARGGYAALVSGGFAAFTRRVAALAGFDADDANELGVARGALTGEVGRPIKGRAAKEAALVRFANARGLGLSETLAVGDGANDLDMLARAGAGVAYRAKPKVAEAARFRVDHGDLTALLFLQGIPRREFVTP